MFYHEWIATHTLEDEPLTKEDIVNASNWARKMTSEIFSTIKQYEEDGKPEETMDKI